MTTVNINPNQAALDNLYLQKGEVVTQLEICQGKLQMINQQIQQFFNAQNQPQSAK